MQLNLLPTVQQAITNLLTVYEPEVLRFGYGLFLSFATILIVWQGIRMMFSHDGLGDQMFEFAKLLMLISFGYAMITFYEAPIPGFGVSFSNLITDQAGYFQSVLEARAFDNIYRHFDELADHFMQPDAWSILATLIYWTVLLLVALAKAVSLAVIAFGLIASAVCGLLGPIFVPFFFVPQLHWLVLGLAGVVIADLLSFCYRPQARLAVLGLAEIVHPVLVHPGRGSGVSDDLRTVRVPIRNNVAADAYASGILDLRPSGVCGCRHLLYGHSPRAIADAVDFLRFKRGERF